MLHMWNGKGCVGGRCGHRLGGLRGGDFYWIILAIFGAGLVVFANIEHGDSQLWLSIHTNDY